MRWAALWLVVACGGEEVSLPAAPAFGDAVSAPMRDPSGECVDVVGELRVCWGEAGVQVMNATRPEGAELPHDARWRCAGAGQERRCVLEQPRSFQCGGGGCIQRAPRLPDDRMWECADVRGVVVCRSRSASAGVIPGPAAEGWLCGNEGPMPICVDLDPDWPSADHRACRYRHEPHFVRECRAGSETVLGSACNEASECPEGMTCASQRCVPEQKPKADCWTANDCEEGERCVIASCVSP